MIAALLREDQRRESAASAPLSRLFPCVMVLLLLGACASTGQPVEQEADSMDARLERVLERAQQAAAPPPGMNDPDRPASSVTERAGMSARELVQANRLPEALAAYDAMLKRNPKDPRALDGRGVVLDLLGLGEEARRSYQAALEVEPGYLSAMNNLGLSLALDGRYDEAIDVLREAASHPQAQTRHRQNLALAYGLAGHDDAAAAVAGQDLDAGAIQENLEFYRSARGLREQAP